MTERAIARKDARLIADAASECADKALAWKDRALRAEALLARFCDWVDRADAPDDDAAYLNGEHPEQRAADRDGWSDIRDIRREAGGIDLPETYADAFLVEWERDGETWVHAHADEPTAVDQARKHGGTCTPLYRRLTPITKDKSHVE